MGYGDDQAGECGRGTGTVLFQQHSNITAPTMTGVFDIVITTVTNIGPNQVQHVVPAYLIPVKKIIGIISNLIWMRQK